MHPSSLQPAHAQALADESKQLPSTMKSQRSTPLGSRATPSPQALGGLGGDGSV
jgi:hypothetical protein